MTSAVARTAWTPVRSEPAHRAEMVSQWLCGERLTVLDRQGDWLRCRGPDGYEGWSSSGSLLETSETEAAEWGRRATGYSLGTPLRVEATSAGAPSYLPWGARVRLLEGGELELPGGVRARAEAPAQVVATSALAEMFPRDGPSVVRAARRWLGVPYLWGGRTRSGVDCSGLVQAVFAVHGIFLPRDSREQADWSARWSATSGFLEDLGAAGETTVEGLERGDLLFFAPEGEGVTHVAIASGGPGSGFVIHSTATRACVVEEDLAGDEALTSLLRRSVVASVRLPDMG